MIANPGSNTFATTVNPTGGQLTVTSSDASDTFPYFTYLGAPAATVKTSDQSTQVADRTLTFTYTVNTIAATQTKAVTARTFAYLQPQTLPGNICSGFGYKYVITYTTYTHPDKKALASTDAVSGVTAAESFNPPNNGSCGNFQTGNSVLDSNALFSDTLANCSNAAIPACSQTTTQTWTVGGPTVRTNQLTFTNTALTYTSQGPTQ